MAAQDVVRTSAAAPLACKLRVRFGECDPQGVVFNAHFLAYFDIGMTELFRAAFGTLGGYQAMVEAERPRVRGCGAALPPPGALRRRADRGNRDHPAGNDEHDHQLSGPARRRAAG